MPKVIDCKPGSIEGGSVWKGRGRFHKTSVMIYTVLGDNTTQTEDDILGAIGLPVLGTRVRGMFFTGAKAKEIDTHALLWEITVTFDSEAQGLNDEETLSPTELRPDWNWDFETLETLLDVDQVTGAPIQTVAGEKIPMMGEIVIPVLNIVRTEDYFDPITILVYGGTVCSTEFWGFPVGTAYMAGIRDKKQVIETIEYREVNYIIKFNVLMSMVDGEFSFIGWDGNPLHQGTYYIDYLGNKNPFLDEAGKPRLGNLDALGDNNGTADPVYLNFKKKRRSNFNTLNLGPW